jgi:hypothetical protein
MLARWVEKSSRNGLASEGILYECFGLSICLKLLVQEIKNKCVRMG